MKLVSNHLLKLDEFKSINNVITRINLAHIRDISKLRQDIINIKGEIFLDFPKGRNKPPVSTITLLQTLNVIQEYDNVKYFAVSNIESKSEVEMIMSLLPKHTSFIPKIETITGVIKLNEILECNITNIMLDGEDLYTSCYNDTSLYLYMKDRVKNICDEKKVKILELQGVIFY